MPQSSVIVSLLAAFGTVGSAVAQQRIEYEDYRLANGLRVVLVEDHSVPVITVNVWYNVGSADERPGRSGFAHLFEHMMFQGSAHVDKAEHFQLVERAGGSMNGTTNEDRTNYFETLPANRLNLALWLEADRMRSLAITEENFENQRNAVQEERRLRIDNQPYAPAFVEGTAQMWNAETCFAYAHSVIGSMDDLNAAEVADVQAFFDLYYAPNNATLVVVGDFTPDEARRLIEQFFGDIPAGDPAGSATCDWELGTEAQTLVWDDPHANLPLTMAGYRVPAHDHEDTPALALLSQILGTGESSRLNRELVREQQIALQAGTQVNSRRLASMFAVLAVANQGRTAEQLAEQLAREVARVREEGITPEELAKAKSGFRSSDIFGRQTTMAVAERIQHYLRFHQSLDAMYTDLDAHMAVTADDIQRVAQRYLTPENSFTILVVPQRATETPVP